MPYVANCPISSPIAVSTRPDVDFNGFMWSYTIGLMFPPQAAMTPMVRLPSPQPATNAIGKR